MINFDYTLAMPAAVTMGLHYGDIGAMDAAFDNVVDIAGRGLLEPRQVTQALGKLVMASLAFN